jgi:undecaprenyl-diphosphatase
LSINPAAGVDHEIARWFFHHGTPTSTEVMLGVSLAGSGVCIGVILFLCVLFLAWKRHWYGLMALLLTVPGGMLLNFAVKFAVQRQRPLAELGGWDPYSFPSGHSNGATLLYGILIVGIVPMLRGWHWRALATLSAVMVVLLVGFSRIVLGAHYLTDVVGGIALGMAWLVLCLTLVRALRRLRSPAERNKRLA